MFAQRHRRQRARAGCIAAHGGTAKVKEIAQASRGDAEKSTNCSVRRDAYT